MNMYAYVANDPINFSDPNGEERIKVNVRAIAGFFGGAKLKAQVMFDTDNFETTISFRGGVGEVIGAFAGGDIDIDESPSDIGPARNDIEGRLSASSTLSGGAGLAGEAELNLSGGASLQDGLMGPQLEGSTNLLLGVGLAQSNTADLELNIRLSIVRDVLAYFGIQPKAEEEEENKIEVATSGAMCRGTRTGNEGTGSIC